MQKSWTNSLKIVVLHLFFFTNVTIFATYVFETPNQ